MNNEQIIRKAYELAEKVDVKGWVGCFTPGRNIHGHVSRRHLPRADGPNRIGADGRGLCGRRSRTCIASSTDSSPVATSSSWSSPSRARTRAPFRRNGEHPSVREDHRSEGAVNDWILPFNEPEDSRRRIIAAVAG